MNSGTNINSNKLLISATCVGSILEMYDFVIYTSFAVILSRLFFPKGDPQLALLATFGTFAIGYFSRPIGGLIFGHIADRLGRRSGLLYTIVSMGVPIVIIGLLPSFNTIGYAAPILLLLCRILQGLSVGGEFPSAATFLAEHAPARRRAYFSSWVFFGINFGIAFASAAATIITLVFSSQQIHEWAWRIPFLFGGVLVIISYYIRRKLYETPVYQQTKNQQTASRFPLSSVIKNNFSSLVIGFGLIIIMAAAIGTCFLFTPTYLQHYLKVPLKLALLLNTINIILFTLLIPITALLADRFGRKPLLSLGAILFILLAYPAYHLIQQQTVPMIMLGLFILAICAACIIGPIAATLAELFKTTYRVTGVAISYNISFGVVGGLTPFLLTYFLGKNNLSTPGFYLMATAFISLIFIIIMRESKQHSL